MNIKVENSETQKNVIPLSVLKRIFKARAERRSKLKGTSVMRSSSKAISEFGNLVVAYAERLADQIMDVTDHAGFNTVAPKHVEFYNEKFSANVN